MDFNLLDDLVDIGGDFAGVALEAFSFADFLTEKEIEKFKDRINTKFRHRRHLNVIKRKMNLQSCVLTLHKLKCLL
jgi:hypothetical protein